MGWLTTTTTLSQRTALPPSTSLPRAISLLQNHDFVLRLDPEYVSHISRPSPPLACSGRQTNQNARHYTVTDHMNALPRGIWDSTVTFEAALTDTEKGTHWVIHGPMDYTQTSNWAIEGEEGDLELVETATIEAKMLLAGMIKKKILGNSPRIHRRILEELAKGDDSTAIPGGVAAGA